MRVIRWFRVAADPYPTTKVVCDTCLHKSHVLLNRVFGASQKCAECGITDAKEYAKEEKA